MLPLLFATIFVGLMIVALTAALLSTFLFRNSPPLMRSSITAAAAWLTASVALHFLPSAYEPRFWERPLFLLPFAIIVWLLMWRSYALYWEDDAALAAEAAEAEAKAWPELASAGPALAEAVPGEPEARPWWVVRHWRGECPLPVAYWVNSLLVVFLLTVLGAQLVRGIEIAGAPLQAVSIAALLFLVTTLLLWAWGAVGTWRSAMVHEDRGGSGNWAIAAQVMVVLGAFLSFVQVRSIAYQGWEYGVLAFGGDSLGRPARVTLEEGGATIRIDGTLTSGTSGRFRALAADAPGLRRVLLDSPGGRGLEAMRIARTIRARGLDTRAEGQCNSACTMILLAGRDRSASPWTGIGFHQPDFPGWSQSQRRLAIAETRQEYLALGLDGRFVDRALTAAPESMWMPPHEELVRARVLTATEIDVRGVPPLFDRIERLAARIEPNLPARMDDATRFEEVHAQGPVLVHLLTFLGAREGLDMRGARIALGDAAQRQVCADEDNVEALAEGANFVFLYRDREERPLFQITIEGCGRR